MSVLVVLLSGKSDLEQGGLGSDELMREDLPNRWPLFRVFVQES